MHQSTHLRPLAHFAKGPPRRALRHRVLLGPCYAVFGDALAYLKVAWMERLAQ